MQNFTNEEIEELNELSDEEIIEGFKFISREDKIFIMNHQNISYRIIEILSNDSDEFIRFEVSKLSNLEFELLDKLADDESEKVRVSTMNNPNISIDTLIKKSEDTSYWVRKSIIQNKNCSIDILKKIMTYSTWDEKLGFLRDKDTPTEILDYFLANKELWVRIPSMKEITDNIYPKMTFETPYEELINFENQKNYFYLLDQLKVAIIRNPNCNQDIFNHLSKDKSIIVRENVLEYGKFNYIDKFKIKLGIKKSKIIKKYWTENPKLRYSFTISYLLFFTYIILNYFNIL